MSRTYRKYPYGQHRKPKRNNANKYNSRPGAIPPDAWDDISFSDESLQKFYIALKMLRQGKSDEEIIKSLERRKTTNKRAKKILKEAKDYHEYKQKYG